MSRTKSCLVTHKIAILKGHGDVSHHGAATSLSRRLFVRRHEVFSYLPILFQAFFTKQSVEAQVALVIERQCAAIVVIGRHLGVLVREVLLEGGYDIPIIHSGLTEPLEAAKNSASVVVSPPSEEDIARCLGRIRKYMPRLLFPYCDHGAHPMMSARSQKLRSCLQSEGFEVHAHPVASREEALLLVQQHVGKVDVVFDMEGGCVSIRSDAILFCWKNKVPVCSGSGRQALEAGFPMAYGGDFEAIAEAVCDLLDLHFEERVPFDQIPLKTVNYERHFMINESMFLQFGVPKEAIEVLKAHDDIEVVREWIDRPEQEVFGLH